MKSIKKRFYGGYTFRAFSLNAVSSDISNIHPDTVTVRLEAFKHEEYEIKVKPGDTVSAGQVIASTSFASVVAPVSGNIEKVANDDQDSKDSASIVILCSESIGTKSVPSAAVGSDKLFPNAMITHLGEKGYIQLMNPSIVSMLKTNGQSAKSIHTVLISALDTAPYHQPCGQLLSGETLDSFISGVEAIGRLYENAGIYIGISQKDKTTEKALSAKLDKNSRCSLLRLDPRYPAGAPDHLALLVKPSGGHNPTSLENRGIAAFSTGEIISIGEAFCKGIPYTHQRIYCSGPGVRSACFLRVPVGTSVDSILSGLLLEGISARVVAGNLISGTVIDDCSKPVSTRCTQLTVIEEGNKNTFLDFIRPGLDRDSYTRTFLSMLGLTKKRCTTNLHGELRPCVQCGFCSEVCPAGLLPNLLYHRGNRTIIDETLLQLKIFACIDCNLCNYVCPSKLPIAQKITVGKEQLIKQGFVSLEQPDEKAKTN